MHKSSKHPLSTSRTIYLHSHQIVALRKLFVDGQESYDSNNAKSCVFRAHDNAHTVLHSFLRFLKHSTIRRGKKEILQTFVNSLYSLLSSEIFQIALISFENSNCTILCLSARFPCHVIKGNHLLYLPKHLKLA
jgi:hypothetical protein